MKDDEETIITAVRGRAPSSFILHPFSHSQEIEHQAHDAENLADAAQNVLPSQLVLVLVEILSQPGDLPVDRFEIGLQALLVRRAAGSFPRRNRRTFRAAFGGRCPVDARGLSV